MNIYIYIYLYARFCVPIRRNFIQYCLSDFFKLCTISLHRINSNVFKSFLPHCRLLLNGLNMMDSSSHNNKSALTMTTSNTNNFKIRLEDIEQMRNKNCKIQNPDRVEQIINEFIKGGTKRLQLVSDFDYTITKQRTSDGTPVLSSFGMFNACQSLPINIVEGAKQLYNKYRPIEIDPHIPLEEKVKYMIEWWTKSGDLLVGFSFDCNEIDHIAMRYKDALRDQARLLFERLYDLNVPVLVFSAGLGDSVVAVLKHAEVLFPNVRVISNFLRYKNGLVDGFKEPMIHTFNKNETILQGSDYYNLVHNRDHIIVMGDSIGDANMAAGVPLSSHILKIGFLYDYADNNLEKYMNAFDIVLIDDQTMNVPLALLKVINEYENKLRV